jgi:hypothetical protein
MVIYRLWRLGFQSLVSAGSMRIAVQLTFWGVLAFFLVVLLHGLDFVEKEGTRPISVLPQALRSITANAAHF